ncbi:structural maintenance of chromosomes 5 smc5 [Blumeria hordei DH14]|uniref:Structural maintenance of chromosomes protein 5 n=1 Tax=Blumeria graminis f. sp. hordei (strain DH14) TaxID=546991 RepID=N1JGF5_BLUG1|nr:structural maintenance of chromosomes 5 smc5 [Blumeria hordei DH14]
MRSPSRRKRPRSLNERDDDSDSSDQDLPEISQPLTTQNKRIKLKANRLSTSRANDTPGGTYQNSNFSEHHSRNTINEDSEIHSSQFQHGAIVRVKVVNFVTYEEAEFFPGPNLNMVIGPNGTGKSSLVCAICLGLGSSPTQLGRATQVGEFVKHSMPDSIIEIELQGDVGEENYIIRSRILREDNSREWWLNGQRSNLKAVKLLVEKLSIQIDNLCQFLPQEKVAEFSALSPSELLLQTQRAAAPPDVLEKHEELKKLRTIEKSLEVRDEAVKQELKTHETRQQNLHAQVQKLQERMKIQEKIALLEKQVPFVEYKMAIADHNAAKARKLAAHKVYEELEARISPTLHLIDDKKSYSTKIEAAVRERKAVLQLIERQGQSFRSSNETLTEEIGLIDLNLASVADQEKETKLRIGKCQKNITNWQNLCENRTPVFNASEWNQRARAKEQESRELKTQLSDLKVSLEELHARGRSTKQSLDAAHEELHQFDSHEGQLMNKLEQQSKDTAKAWKWIQEHQADFEMEVFAPPLITCSMKNSRYTRQVESLIGRNDMFTISAQTKADFKKLSDQLNGTMRLTDITIKQVDHPTVPNSRPLSDKELQQYGMIGWAIDQIDGPGPVLSMLCDSARLDRSAIAHDDISEETYQTIIREERLNVWVTQSQRFNVTRRKEYGPGAISTITRPVPNERFWTDQPVDASARAEIQARIETIEGEFQALKRQNDPLKTKIIELRGQDSTIQDEIKQILQEKAKLQEADKELKALPERIKFLEQEEANLRKAQDRLLEHRETVQKLHDQHDQSAVQKAENALRFAEHLSGVRKAHENLLEAQIRFIEAESDVESLIALNSSIVQQRDEERERVREIDEEAKRIKAVASKALKICKAILADPENEAHTEQLAQQPDDTTVEALEMEIAAEESKLEYLAADNPNAIEQFATREAKVQELRIQVDEIAQRLQRIQQKICKIRGEWEPALDNLINTINDAFSYNFEQIGCAGEVSIEKKDDFENWAIQIKVKFRENETLQVLDQHRQSGGERSVSTIFYLMALQSLATSPFRVVDEINQGMDPRNERLVHERMVEIACKEHTSQYFLITPKLLTGLCYDRRMKILCITSGPHMPTDYQQLNVSRIIRLRRAILAAR